MKHYLKKIFSLLAAFLLTASCIPLSVSAEGLTGPDIYAKTYCVIDGETGEVLMEKDKDAKMYPASTTKILTALLVLENVEDLDAELVFTESAVGVDPISSTLEPKAMAGEVMTVRDALYGMLLKSANECGAMLGEYVAGTESAFAELMNERAEEIGCKNSHFVNAYGIHDDNHYTTAYDLALILREAMKNEAYRELNATVEYTIPATNMSEARTFTNGHGMISGTVPGEGVVGGKTGHTTYAGRTLATACTRDGYYTISTLMGSDTDHFWMDEQVLLEYTYAIHSHTYRPVEWVETGDSVTVSSGTGANVRLSPSLLETTIGTLQPGETVLRTAVYEGWSKIEYNGGTGYVSSDLLTSLEPEKVPETAPYEWEEEAPETGSYEWPEETAEETTEETAEETAEKSSEASSEETVSAAESTSSENASSGAETSGEKPAEREETSFWTTENLLLWAPAAFAGVLLLVWIAALIRHIAYRRKHRTRKG